MGVKWANIPDRSVSHEGSTYVCVTEEEAQYLIDSRELADLLDAVEGLTGDNAFSAISTEIVKEDGVDSRVWMVMGDIQTDDPANENAAWGANLIHTIKELIVELSKTQSVATDFENMTAKQIVDIARGVRDTMLSGYLAWRSDSTQPELDVVELWDFPRNKNTPEIMAIGRGTDDVEALRNLLIGLRDKNKLR